MNQLNPSFDYPAWMILDYESLLSNLTKIQKSSCLLNLDIKPLRKIWPDVYEDFYRNGIEGIFCRDPRNLFLDPLTKLKLLVPPYPNRLLGYSGKEFIPVLENYKECLFLSNMGQTQDCSHSFLLRVNSTETEFASGNYGLFDILERSENLPMIECVGFYLEKDIVFEDFKRFIKPMLVKKSISIEDLKIVTTSSHSADPSPYFGTIGIELFGINLHQTISSAISIGCWVYPRARVKNATIASIDLGCQAGLGQTFPIHIQGYSGKIITSELYSTEVEFPGHLSGVFPWKAILCGNEATDIISPTEWTQSNLITLINNWEFPVYLLRNCSYKEYLP